MLVFYRFLLKKNGPLWHHLFHHYLNTCQWNFTNVYSNEICLRNKKQLLKYQLNNWAGCCTSVGLKLVVWYILLENKNNNEKKKLLVKRIRVKMDSCQILMYQILKLHNAGFGHVKYKLMNSFTDHHLSGKERFRRSYWTHWSSG